MVSSDWRFGTCWLVAGLFAAAPALAQAPAPTPNVTTANFGDWVLRCESRADAPRACEVLQSLLDQRRQPVAQFAFGRAQRGQTMRLIVLIPANITVLTPLLIHLPDRGPPIPVTLRACGPRGCVAEAEVNAAQLARLRAREAQGRLEYRDALNAEVALPFSTRGFGAALDALAREGL